MQQFFVVAMLLAMTASIPTAAMAAHVAAATQRHTVQFAKGQSAAQVRGTIQGDRDAECTVNARAGQTLAVTLKTSNTSNYSNISPPGAHGAAMLIGSAGGAEAKLMLPADGTYFVQVHLMRNATQRNAARRDERDDAPDALLTGG